LIFKGFAITAPNITIGKKKSRNKRTLGDTQINIIDSLPGLSIFLTVRIVKLSVLKVNT